MSARRVAAIGALILGVGGLGLAAVIAVQEFPRGLIALVCMVVAVTAIWFGLLRRGASRVGGLFVGAVGIAAAILPLVGERLLEELVVIAALGLGCACGRAAFKIHTPLPRVPGAAAAGAVLEPALRRRQGEHFSLAEEARAAGSSRSNSGPGGDLEELVHEAVAGGADALAMAGGDGSQAIVAAVAAEHGLPYACVPAGHPQPLRAGPRGRPRRRGRRARRVRRRRRAARRPGGGQRPRLREQRLARPLRRRRPAPRATATPSSGRSSTPCPRCSAPSRRHAPSLGRPRRPRAPPGAGDPRVQQPLPARPHDRVRNPPAHRCRLLGVAVLDARPHGGARSGPGGTGPRSTSRSTPTGPSTRASTARPSRSSHRCDSPAGRGPPRPGRAPAPGRLTVGGLARRRLGLIGSALGPASPPAASASPRGGECPATTSHRNSEPKRRRDGPLRTRGEDHSQP